MPVFFWKRRSGQPKQLLAGTKPKRIGRYMFWGVLVLALLVVGWVVGSSLLAWNKISSTNTGSGASYFDYNGDIPAAQLKTEGDGRINVLLVGIGGVGHNGPYLTDSIEVISIDPINKTMSLLSIPRDLYVTSPYGGKTKINAIYSDGYNRCQADKKCVASGVDQGGEQLKQVVTNVIGVPMQYFVRVDFSGFTEVVDSLGGVQVYVDKAINDPYYPDARLIGYDPFSISAGLHQLDGATALKYARSRETTSDFDRARRQQQIIAAVKQKALSLGVLTNPKKITDLINIMGSHLKTDLKLNESVTLLSLIKQVDDSKTTSKVLDTSAGGPLTAVTDPRAGYIIYPRIGMSDFTDVQEVAESIMPEPYLIKEHARLELVVPTNKKTAGDQTYKKLKALGYNVTETYSSTIAPANNTLAIVNQEPYTVALLKKRFVVSETSPSSADKAANQYDLILTLGSRYQAMLPINKAASTTTTTTVSDSKSTATQ